MNFEALPTELKCQVLSCLSVREKLRFRLVNRHACDLIDNSASWSNLTSLTINKLSWDLDTENSLEFRTNSEHFASTKNEKRAARIRKKLPSVFIWALSLTVLIIAMCLRLDHSVSSASTTFLVCSSLVALFASVVAIARQMIAVQQRQIQAIGSNATKSARNRRHHKPTPIDGLKFILPRVRNVRKLSLNVFMSLSEQSLLNIIGAYWIGPLQSLEVDEQRVMLVRDHLTSNRFSIGAYAALIEKYSQTLQSIKVLPTMGELPGFVRYGGKLLRAVAKCRRLRTLAMSLQQCDSLDPEDRKLFACLSNAPDFATLHLRMANYMGTDEPDHDWAAVVNSIGDTCIVSHLELVVTGLHYAIDPRHNFWPQIRPDLLKRIENLTLFLFTIIPPRKVSGWIVEAPRLCTKLRTLTLAVMFHVPCPDFIEIVSEWLTVSRSHPIRRLQFNVPDEHWLNRQRALDELRTIGVVHVQLNNDTHWQVLIERADGASMTLAVEVKDTIYTPLVDHYNND